VAGFMLKKYLRKILQGLSSNRREGVKASDGAASVTAVPDISEASPDEKSTPKIPHILVYAIEREGLTPPGEELRERNYRLSFEPFETKKRFNDFDGVVVLQGCFEKVEETTNSWGNSYCWVECAKDELDKRLNEAVLLLKEGGWICFLLVHPFVDKAHGNYFKGTDLAKIFLNFDSFYRESRHQRTTALTCKRSEFKRFLDIYGGGFTTFSDNNGKLGVKPIATIGYKLAGMMMGDNRFFVPAFLPDKTKERVTEFFRLLVDALVSTRNKLVFEIPEWVDEFVFEEESVLLKEREELIAKVEDINGRLEGFGAFKRLLIEGGEQLVETVEGVLSAGLELRVDAVDEYREDLKILNDEGEPIIFCEVKGVNRGVKREYVNQADSHRERAGLSSSFPALLVVNTHIKNSRSLAEKDKEVPQEHIAHARKINVLILRSLDLLGLLKLKMERGMTKEEVLSVLCSGGGWLRVTGDKWDVLTGEDVSPKNEGQSAIE